MHLSHAVRALICVALSATLARAQTEPEPESEPQPETAAPAPTPTSSPTATPTPIPQPTPQPSPPDDTPRPHRALCLSFGVVGAAALVSGITLGALARQRSDEQEGNLAAPSLYDADLKARGQQGETMATAAYALLAIGSAFAVADVILWIERLRPHQKKAERAAMRPFSVSF